MMDNAKYLEALNKQNIFDLRKGIERLRAGLFDTLAVRLLTVHEQKLDRLIDQGIQSLKSGRASHLCVRGAYGQGKSHTLLYIRERALRENFVTSSINLDIRELPLHSFRQVYRHLIRNIRFPDKRESLASYWKIWVKENSLNPDEVVNLLPEEIPHLFRSVLVALAQKNISLSDRERQLKKNASFRPREIHHSLERALCGDVIPAIRLRNALKFRQVPFYKERSLSFQGTDQYIEMVQGLAALFKKMGFKGWVVLFDEGESITQLRISARSLAYRILDNMFSLNKESSALYPVFAFTDDFFTTLSEEDYDRTVIRKNKEVPCFQKRYDEAWKGLTFYTLQDFTRTEWAELAEKLLYLYMKAYEWKPDTEELLPKMRERTTELSGEETRYIFKALVEHLDVLAF